MSIEKSFERLQKDVLGGVAAMDKALDIIIEGQEKMIAGEAVDSAEEQQRIKQLFDDLGKESEGGGQSGG